MIPGANIRPGKMRHRVTLMTISSTGYGSRGQEATSYSSAATGLNAGLEQLRGREGELARQAFPEATHFIRMWYRSDIDTTAKLVFTNVGTTAVRTFQIFDVNNVDERNHFCLITAGEDKS